MKERTNQGKSVQRTRWSGSESEIGTEGGKKMEKRYINVGAGLEHPGADHVCFPRQPLLPGHSGAGICGRGGV